MFAAKNPFNPKFAKHDLQALDTEQVSQFKK